MTPDVRVRRCTITVRRRSGWSWGPDPEALVRQALAALEEGLARAVSDLEPDAELTVRVPLTLRIGRDGAIDQASSVALAGVLRRELETSASEHSEQAEPASANSGAPDQGETLAEVPALNAPVAIAALLARWFVEGVLGRVLSSWPEPVLAAWEAALAGITPDATALSMVEADLATVEQVVDAFMDSGDVAVVQRAGLARLLVLAALAASHGGLVPGPFTHAHVHTVLERSTRDSISQPAPLADPLEVVELATQAETTTPPTPRLHPDHLSASTGAFALPLLVLAQLDRVGYLQTAVGALHAAGLGDCLPAFGAAIAGKCFDPPERGWRRRPAERGTLAAASGLAEPPPHSGLARLAQRRELFLIPLRSALEVAYTLGRATWEPVTVAHCADGIVIAEEEGLMPIAWIGDQAEMDAVLELLGRPPAGDEGALELAAFASAMAERPAIPRTDAPDLERHLGAAVGTALALLASDLWGEKGPTSPLLALRRLGDLEALVEPGPDGLIARLPLGQRRMDLQRVGALEDAMVPWFPAGRLRFSAW